MFNDPVECYEAIGASLSGAANQPWDRIELDATLDDMRVDAVVGCWRDDASEATYLTGVPRLARFIYELAQLVSTKEKGLFKKCHFVLHKNGKFNVDFSY